MRSRRVIGAFRLLNDSFKLLNESLKLVKESFRLLDESFKLFHVQSAGGRGYAPGHGEGQPSL